MMILPNSTSESLSPGDASAPREALPGSPMELATAAFVAGLRVLLQSRLRLLSLILTVFFALSLPFLILLFGLDTDFVWSALLPQCVILAIVLKQARAAVDGCGHSILA